ncbi:MAG: DUF2681 domain-containing protein [[Actinobacillus] rossii]|nr:DUF2681 domain-containing protein [[Actinobacillus] rossii]
MSWIFIASSVVFIVVFYGAFKLKQANNEIEKILKTNAALKAQKDTAETQVKNAEVRKKNEESTITRNRNELIDSLQQSNDLRD